MKSLFKIIISLILLGLIFYQIDQMFGLRTIPAWSDFKSQIITKYFPCKEPIPYTLGSFDTKFNISQKDFLDVLAEAENTWESSIGINLFLYKPDDTSLDVLKVNLIYDYREQVTSKLAILGIAVKNTKGSYDALKSKLTELKLEYQSEKDILTTKVATFNEKKAYYEQQVEYWNSKGGAPQKEYNVIQGLALELQAMAGDLKILEAQVNDLVSNINSIVVALNNIAKSINLAVTDYNTINTSRGDTFEQGLYKSDGLTREIDIYEFSSKEKLLKVLIHELGHALGLEHSDDPKAIMYSLNEGTNTSLTTTDLTALKKLCGVN